jgi:adenylate cyclase
MNILIVDDDPGSLGLLRAVLEKDGHTVREAPDGVAALAVLGRESVDAVISDIAMPAMDGRQLLTAIKADATLSHLPVIMISGAGDREMLVDCIAGGAEDYLAKPFDLVLLRARLRAFLEKKRLHDNESTHLRRIQEQKLRADELLHVILPDTIAAELMEHECVQPQRHDNVGVLFADVVGFTAYCESHPPEEVLGHLQALILRFEEIAARHGLEKIKTIGDGFMATAGLLEPAANPGLACVRCGLEMAGATRTLASGWSVRIGIHVGPVIAGVVGHRKFFFDVWGATVNTAARLCALANPGSVFVGAETWRTVQPWCQGQSCGRLEVKGKGTMELYAVAAADPLPESSFQSNGYEHPHR